MSADNDHLVADRGSPRMQGVDYFTVGEGHSSIYSEATQDLIVRYLLQDTDDRSGLHTGMEHS